MASEARPQIIVAADAEALAEIAVERLLARVMPAKKRAAVCLTGGPSPEGLYRRLAREPYRSTLPWDRGHWFLGDGRFVAGDHKHSNMGMGRRLVHDPLLAPANTMHAIPTDADRPDLAARRYEAELKHFYGRDRFDPAHPLFDLVLMGLASDGHTASLFPNSPALDERERWVVGVEEAGLAPFVPRVTLHLPRLAVGEGNAVPRHRRRQARYPSACAFRRGPAGEPGARAGRSGVACRPRHWAGGHRCSPPRRWMTLSWSWSWGFSGSG